MVTILLPPRVLLRLNFSTGIPPAHRTMVVIPTLLSKTEELDTLVETLEIRYLGNRDAYLFFALLTDFRDAAEQSLASDDALIAYARNAIETINASYSDDRACIFYLFHRPRTWNPIDMIFTAAHDRI